MSLYWLTHYYHIMCLVTFSTSFWIHAGHQYINCVLYNLHQYYTYNRKYHFWYQVTLKQRIRKWQWPGRSTSDFSGTNTKYLNTGFIFRTKAALSSVPTQWGNPPFCHVLSVVFALVAVLSPTLTCELRVLGLFLSLTHQRTSTLLWEVPVIPRKPLSLTASWHCFCWQPWCFIHLRVCFVTGCVIIISALGKNVTRCVWKITTT